MSLPWLLAYAVRKLGLGTWVSFLWGSGCEPEGEGIPSEWGTELPLQPPCATVLKHREWSAL